MAELQGKIEVALLNRVTYVRVGGLATMHNCGALADLCNRVMECESDEFVFDLADMLMDDDV